MQTILIVEDDRKIGRIIELQLRHAGYATQYVPNGAEAIALFAGGGKGALDLVLLDIMLPGQDGFAVLAAIRQADPAIPVIFLTARDDKRDVIRGLEAGANDYITKPFDFDELIARIHVGLRTRDRAGQDGDDVLTCGDLVVDGRTFTASRGGEEIHLTRKEFDLLYYLVLNRGCVQTRDQILVHVWDYDYEGSENVVDVYIKYLRDKIDRDYEDKLIQTVRGRGYVIK